MVQLKATTMEMTKVLSSCSCTMNVYLISLAIEQAYASYITIAKLRELAKAVFTVTSPPIAPFVCFR